MVAGTFMIGLRSNDVVYSPMPLYHLAAGLLGSGQALARGNTVVLKRKFSVSSYWSDCIKYRCTVRGRQSSLLTTVLFLRSLLVNVGVGSCGKSPS